MIPNTKDRTIASHGVGASSEFAISLPDEAHIMAILRDTLYSDKVLAVLREYSSNAWDAHQMSGKPDLPIKVTLPTEADPTLIIRDFGTGLSTEEIFRYFSQYGASTKRNSDTAVGMLGIGSKSGFSYSDSFTVTSFHGGMKKIFVAVLDETEKGIIQQLHEEPCGEETGIEIKMAVKPLDIAEFTTTAQTLYQYFVPRPDINTEIPPLPEAQLTFQNGIIYDDPLHAGGWGRKEWVAVMGCVTYRINLEQLSNVGNGLPEFIKNISGALFFKIGEVQISASREELKYSQMTKTVLLDRFNALVDEYVQKTMHEIETSSKTQWDKRLRAQVFKKLHLPISESWSEVTQGSVSIKDKIPPAIEIVQSEKEVSEIDVESGARFVFSDDVRALAGFWLGRNDYLVKCAPKTGWNAAEAALEDLKNAVGIMGIGTTRLSLLEWHNPKKRRGQTEKVFNPKHRVRSFKLAPEKINEHGARSRLWEVAGDREQMDEDIFVILHSFKPWGNPRWFNEYAEDTKLMKLVLGKEMPAIYGYKHTEKKPAIESDFKGMTYGKWRKNVLPRLLLTLETKEVLRQWMWHQIAPGGSYSYRQAHENLSKSIGPGHDITTLFREHNKAVEFIKKHPFPADVIYRLQTAVGHLIDTKIAVEFKEKIQEKYPLFALEDTPFSKLWGSQADAWIHYVQSIDKAEAINANTVVHDDQRIDHGDLGGPDAHSPEGDASVRGTEESDPGGELGSNPEEPDGEVDDPGVGEGEVHAEGGDVPLRGNAAA